MAPLLRASVGLHALAAATALAQPALWPWLVSGLALNHAVLSAAGLTPRCSLLGPNLTRLPAASRARHEVALTIDDGPDPAVTPAVLDLLDAQGAKATFFCIAERAQAHAALTREIVARGHSVQNHSHGHRHHFALLGPGGIRAEIKLAQQVLTDLTGQRPTCFRAPAGLRNPFLESALHPLGLRLVSWTRRGFDTCDTQPQRVLARLSRNLASGDILLLHDGNAARSANGLPVSLAVLPALLAACRAAGLQWVSLPQALGQPVPAVAAAA